MERIKFEIGHTDSYTGLYGGNYTVKVVARTENTVTLRSFWIAEDTGEDCHDDTVYDIEVHDLVNGIESERIVIWEYRGERGYLYPVSEDFRDYVYEWGKLPTDDEDEEIDWNYHFDREYRSAYDGDYSPSAPWNAPGMSVHDFI